MAKILTNLHATGWASDFKNGSAHGAISANANKQLTQITGTIDGLGGFNGSGDPNERLNITFTPIELSKAKQLAEAVEVLVPAIDEELQTA